ncbi:MAG TPA: hypothetical protein VI112_16300, partial [Bacteroidia bacterium]
RQSGYWVLAVGAILGILIIAELVKEKWSMQTFKKNGKLIFVSLGMIAGALFMIFHEMKE